MTAWLRAAHVCPGAYSGSATDCVIASGQFSNRLQLLKPDPSLSALHAAVADAYRVFHHHASPSFPLDVCTPCCVSKDIEQQLRQWPLAKLTAQHLYEYNTSAKSESQPSQEVGHLLPRMLELLAEGAEIHHSIELSLDRLGRCPQDSWNDDEHDVLNRFALAYFDRILLGGPLGEGHHRWPDDTLSALLMFDIGGRPVEPLLHHWLQCEDPVSTVQFVTATHYAFWKHREYTNAFASDRPIFRGHLREWLLKPAHRQRFAGKLLTPEFQEQALLQPPIGYMDFSAMMESVFDELVQ